MRPNGPTAVPGDPNRNIFEGPEGDLSLKCPQVSAGFEFCWQDDALGAAKPACDAPARLRRIRPRSSMPQAPNASPRRTLPKGKLSYVARTYTRKQRSGVSKYGPRGPYRQTVKGGRGAHQRAALSIRADHREGNARSDDRRRILQVPSIGTRPTTKLRESLENRTELEKAEPLWSAYDRKVREASCPVRQ